MLMTAQPPTTRQENEAALGLRPFDDLQRDTLGGRGIRGTLAGIALVGNCSPGWRVPA